MKNTLCFLLLFCALSLPAAATPSSDIEKQIDSILSKMTLQEKLGQLQMLPGENGKPTTEQLELARKGLLGAALNIHGPNNINKLQQATRESRLKIPLLMATDMLHGYRTILPIPLGQAATFDPELIEKASALAAREARSAGINWTLAPMADIIRDVRWGPSGDTFGEDPHLAAVMTRSSILGLQGSDYSAPNKVAACAKYLAASGGVEGGREGYTVEASLRQLEGLYFPPFKAAAGAGVACFMTSDAALNGLPGAANTWLIRSVLKKGWGFDGMVLSSPEALPYLTMSGLAKNDAEAAAIALNAGVDMETPSQLYSKFLPMGLDNNLVSQANLNDAVRRVLRIKFRAGLRTDTLAEQKTESVAPALNNTNREVAYKTALESIVLLKNEDRILPIRKQIKKILVVGGLADDPLAQLGIATPDGRPNDTITILSAIRNSAEKRGIAVNYEPGTGLFPGPKDDISKAILAAADADLIVAVVGENYYEHGKREMLGNIQPTGEQQMLLAPLSSQGKPVVAVVLSARPLFFTASHITSAILAAWFPGTMGGQAIADILFGETQPSGKLPVSWPMLPGALPIYYNHTFTTLTPQYPFGHGLTYANFELSGLELSKRKISPDGSISVGATLRNKSSVKADEVLQLYIQDAAASAPRPVKELKAFRRVTVGPGKTVKVTFTLGPKQLGFYDINGKFTVEPGEFKVWVATSSAGGLEGSFTVNP